jgi:hypothetical protein
MPTPTHTIFQRFKFDSVQEELASQVLSYEQKCSIHNLIEEAAAARLTLKLDPTNVLPYMQAEAELQGKIGILSYLIEQSASAEAQLKETHHVW